jgi:K319-like protein
MSGSNSTILIIAGIGVGLLALLLLLGSSPEPVAPIGVIAPSVVSSGESYATVVSPVSSTLAVHAGPDQTVGERERVQLSGESSDPNGLPVTYLWTAQGGLGFFENAHSPTTTFTAPSACDCNEMVILTLTVTNSAGHSVFDQIVISVRDPLNCPTMCDSSGFYVTVPVDECQATGLDPVCPATPSEPCESLCISEAPAVEECADAAVPCPCTENVDCSEPWQTGWPFETQQSGHPKDRAKPSIDRHFPREINEEATVFLEGYIRNPACQSVCYSWIASKGWLENSNTLTPTYHAPESDRLEGETVTISLIVYDTAQGRSYDQIRIKIRNTNPG